MIEVEGYNDHTPTRHLRAEVNRLSAGLAPKRGELVLRIVPVFNQGRRVVTAERWYTAHWAVWALCSHPHALLDNCPDRYEYEPGRGEDWDHVALMNLSALGELPAPPVIPVTERLAELEPVTEADIDAAEARQPGVTAMMGGRDSIRTWITQIRDTATRADKTVDIYDWTALAKRIVRLYDDAPLPRRSHEARLRQVGARVQRAQQELETARAAAGKRLRNAAAARENGEAGAGTKSDWHRWTGISRATIDKQLAGWAEPAAADQLADRTDEVDGHDPMTTLTAATEGEATA